MKAELRKVATWTHKGDHKKDKSMEEKGWLRVYVGEWWCGWAFPVREEEGVELFSFEPFKGLIYLDEDNNTFTTTEGIPLQEILDSVELAMKEFLKKVVK